MKCLIQITIFLGMGITARSQFTVIPTGTTSPITDIALHDDTLIISGTNNYFAKSYDMGTTITTITPPGSIGYTNFDLQVIDNNYYILSIEGAPYEHNQILKSTDCGSIWNILYDTSGLFYTLTMLDTAFGVMGGSYGGYAMTQNTDTAWALDTLYSTILASASYGDSTMLLLSFLGYSYVTENRGQTWNWGYCHSAKHSAIQYISKDTVYSVSHIGTGNEKGYFSYSINSGYNFSTINIGYSPNTNQYEYHSRIYDLYFDTPQHGYLVGYIYDKIEITGSVPVNQATIFETNDYGQTWTPYLTGFTEEFYTLLNVNDSTAFIGGSNGLLLKWNKNIPLTIILTTEEIQTTTSTNLFPNPFTETATITLQGIELPTTLTIYDQLGRSVRTETMTGQTHIVSRNALTPGIYHYNIGNRNGKFIITQ